VPNYTLITYEELAADSDAILARAEAGEHFDISVNGVVTVEIVPITSSAKKRRPVSPQSP
jgi:antitoxin (DNA-binding transcriptional repressor) of toxin-antitoxin stability system